MLSKKKNLKNDKYIMFKNMQNNIFICNIPIFMLEKYKTMY